MADDQAFSLVGDKLQINHMFLVDYKNSICYHNIMISPEKSGNSLIDMVIAALFTEPWISVINFVFLDH